MHNVTNVHPQGDMVGRLPLACALSMVLANDYRWTVGGAELRPEATFEGHTDWVNDVALIGSDVLASASADHAVRLWKANSPGEVNSSKACWTCLQTEHSASCVASICCFHTCLDHATAFAGVLCDAGAHRPCHGVGSLAVCRPACLWRPVLAADAVGHPNSHAAETTCGAPWQKPGSCAPCIAAM